MNKVAPLLLAIMLSGCSFLSQNEALPIYTLECETFEPREILSASLVLDTPRGEASLNTQRIAITPSPYQRDYLANAQWPDKLPKVFQEVLLEGLNQRWGATYVSRIGSGIQTQYVLQTEIQDFSVYSFDSKRPEVCLTIVFKLMDLRTREALGGRTFCTKVPVSPYTINAVVEAFNKGLHGLIGEAIPWMESMLLDHPHPQKVM